MEEFRLIETMRVLPDGGVYLLERHLDRLSRSARYFGFKCDLSKVRDEIVSAIRAGGNPCTLRLTLSRDGALTLESRAVPSHNPEKLTLSSARVNSGDVFLYHKTTRREIYDQARRDCDENTDAILVNERGEITETTILNIAVLRHGRWITPKLSCGLLPGVMREELLAQREIAEGVILADELQDGELIRSFNALRGEFFVPLL